MAVFEYVAVDAKKGKKVKERIEAPSAGEAILKLRSLGLVVLDLRQISTEGGRKEKESLLKREITIGKGVGSKDLSILARQLAALIEAGLGIVDALELVADSIDNRVLKRILPEIANEVRGGESLARALERRKKIFGDFFVNMVEVGEETGQLDVVLRKVADYYQRISEIVNKIKSASFYPIFVFITATVITFGILYFLVPTFAQIYRSFGGELPAPTRMLISVSEALQQNIVQILIGLGVFVALFLILYRYVYPFKKAVHWLQLKLPLFGPLFRKGAIARLSRTFATLFSAGVSIDRALELSAKVTGNTIYREAIEQVKNDVLKGEPLWRAFEKTKRFPKMFVAMIKIGEETGQLDQMLESLASFYEDEVKTTIDGLISMIEPLMIVVIGTIVGSILVALYLPIFRLGELIR